MTEEKEMSERDFAKERKKLLKEVRQEEKESEKK